jgi:exonuclease-1
MGIKGLLRELRPLMQRIHVSMFKGHVVGVDALCWLHRASYSCAMDLVLNNGNNEKKKYLEFCRHMIQMLQHHGLTPILVFDGKDKPKMKEGTATQRRLNREKNKAEALRYLELGDKAKANEMCQRAVHVSSDMIQNLMSLLDQMQVPYIRSPYEGTIFFEIFLLILFVSFS